MATAMSSYILLVDLGTQSEKPRVLRRFDHHRARNLVGGGRIVKQSKLDSTGSKTQEDWAGRKNAFEMEETDEAQENTVAGDADAGDGAGPTVTTVSRMAISADGQWLATTDDLARTYIFNMDSVQVSSLSLLQQQTYSTSHSIIVFYPLFLNLPSPWPSSRPTPISS